MKTVNSQLLKKFLELAADKLPGDWVVIGGAVLPLLGVDHRITVDIDLAGPKNSKQEHTLILMEIAENLNIPPEAVNQAGAFFLHKIKGWEKHLVEVYTGKKGRILRPDLSLYIKLKISRMSESDLSDCLKMLSSVEKNERQELKTLIKEIEKEEMKSVESPTKNSRIKELLAALKRHC